MYKGLNFNIMFNFFFLNSKYVRVVCVCGEGGRWDSLGLVTSWIFKVLFKPGLIIHTSIAQFSEKNRRSYFLILHSFQCDCNLNTALYSVRTLVPTLSVLYWFHPIIYLFFSGFWSDRHKLLTIGIKSEEVFCHI